MNKTELMKAAGIGMAVGAAVSLAAVMPRRSSFKKKTDKAMKTAGKIVEGISASLDSIL